MSYLFYIDPLKKTVIHPDCLKLCPELSVLSEEEALCLIIAYDNFSPYRNETEERRIYTASMNVWGDNNPKLFESLKWQNAVLAYKSLQFDPKLELIKTYQAKIVKMQELIMEDDTEAVLNKCLNNIKKLSDSITELEDERREGYQKEGQLVGKAGLSFLENLMRNKQMFEAKTKKK